MAIFPNRGSLLISSPPKHFAAIGFSCYLLRRALWRFGRSELSNLGWFFLLFAQRMAPVGHCRSQLGIKGEYPFFAGGLLPMPDKIDDRCQSSHNPQQGDHYPNCHDDNQNCQPHNHFLLDSCIPPPGSSHIHTAFNNFRFVLATVKSRSCVLCRALTISSTSRSELILTPPSCMVGPTPCGL